MALLIHLVRPLSFSLLLVAAATLRADDSADRVLRSLQPAVEVEGRPPIHWTVTERLAHHHVPGVSVAVVDHGRIVWARGFGKEKAGADGAVTEATLFQAASISKAIAATATLRLVDEGKLDLDTDVNRYLASWKIPETPHTTQEKVTLRRILSHTAGINLHGFMGYPPDGAIPTLLQVLDGQPPAKNEPVRVVAVPGSITNYSGGGIIIEQLVVTDTTKTAFPKLVRDLVLVPLGMKDTTFEHPLPSEFRSRVAEGHNGDGEPIKGGWRIGPEAAAGWMWSTPTDLMRWAIGIAESRTGKPGTILSRKIATEMLTVQKDQYGLGPVLEGSGPAFRFSHGGNNPGYTAQLTYFPETGQGAAIMVNTGTADILIEELTRAIAKEYNWPALQPSTIKPAVLNEKAIGQVTGKYDLWFPGATDPVSAEVRSENGRLTFHSPPVVVNDELVAISATEFISPVWGYRIRFEGNPGNAATGFTLRYGQNDMAGKRAKVTGN